MAAVRASLGGPSAGGFSGRWKEDELRRATRRMGVGALLALTACGASYIGQGPITFSPELRTYYDQYRQRMNPGAFAVAADGSAAGYTYCGEFGGCRGNEVARALQNCRQRSAGKECFIYDIGGRVVWREAASATAVTPSTAPDAAPPGEPAGAGGFPPTVEGVLSSGVEYRPYTASELADPRMRAIIEQCERAGLAHCRELSGPKDRRGSFTPGVDQRVFAHFRLLGLSTGTTYDLECRFIDPAGSAVQVVRVQYTPPPGRSGLNRSCSTPLWLTTPAGRWSLQFLMDGRSASELSFEVLEPSA